MLSTLLARRLTFEPSTTPPEVLPGHAGADRQEEERELHALVPEGNGLLQGQVPWERFRYEWCVGYFEGILVLF